MPFVTISGPKAIGPLLVFFTNKLIRIPTPPLFVFFTNKTPHQGREHQQAKEAIMAIILFANWLMTSVHCMATYLHIGGPA